MMKLKMKMGAVVMLLFIICSQMESVQSDAFDCLDACQTACVSPGDLRLQQRCERKCQIKCGPDSTVEEDRG
ncbi:hypothetical protein HN51_030688 [Arachis hypogaea]|uniref:Thionin-like protein n=1 Tax=Arachis hypogaea TaxID=3818 RepID=A0A445BAA4_ARAHY|nr:uncharacterized protein DS421_10g293040 [Arachis hypogaea]RYR35613.1 hypothetical protein Ahy_A10g050748 [Arachis hypogaea]